MTQDEMLSIVSDYKKSGQTGDVFNEKGEKCGMFKISNDGIQTFCGAGAMPSELSGGPFMSVDDGPELVGSIADKSTLAEHMRANHLASGGIVQDGSSFFDLGGDHWPETVSPMNEETRSILAKAIRDAIGLRE